MEAAEYSDGGSGGTRATLTVQHQQQFQQAIRLKRVAKRQLIVLERGKNRERKWREGYRKIKIQKKRGRQKQRGKKEQRQQRFHLANNKPRAFATNSFLLLMYTAFRQH